MVFNEPKGRLEMGLPSSPKITGFDDKVGDPEPPMLPPPIFHPSSVVSVGHRPNRDQDYLKSRYESPLLGARKPSPSLQSDTSAHFLEDISISRPRSPSFYRGNSPRTAGSLSTYNSPTTLKKILPSITDSFDARAEPVRPDLISAQKRMCVAVDFGTVLSGVACGTSANQVQQILWPGPRRKIPTCLVYNELGRVVEWGQGAQAAKLKKGWNRCEMFKLLLDPTAPSINAFYTLPQGKEPVDLITDYLRKLWENAKPRIRDLGFTLDDLKSADIWISIPATWNVKTGEIMREAAYKAGLVAPQGSVHYDGGRDRLHIVSEPEAAAVHSSLWKDLNLNPNQSFMVCDAGGGTVDTAVYRVLGNVTQIAERCASSGASCGSQFLDLNFRKYLEQWHNDRGIRLSETNLKSYMHSFIYAQKIAFTGHAEHDENDSVLFFECYDTSDYDDAGLPDSEFFAGQLLIPARILREQVFEPVITKAIEVLEDQFSKVDSVDALLLVGGFSASPYLFDRIWDTFHERLKGRIQSPRDPDIATSLGSAQYGLARSLVHRPLGGPTVVASKSYVLGIEATLADTGIEGLSDDMGGNAPPNGRKEVFKTHYLVVKGALLRKGVPVLETMTKFSKDSSDSLFVARLYASDSAEIEGTTNGGHLVHLVDWGIDISAVSSFGANARKLSATGFHTDFQLGIEIDSREVRAVWAHGGNEGGRVRLDSFGRFHGI